MDGSYVPRRAGWDTHGLPVEVEVEKKLGITGKDQIEHQVGIAEFTRLCRESVLLLRRRVRPPDDAHRLLGRHGRGVLDVEPGLHRVGLVAPAAALRPGPALRGPEGRALLPPLRDGAVVARARPARRVPGRGGRVGLRAPAHRRRRSGRGGGRRRVAGGVDDHAVDAAVQHRRGGRTPTSSMRWWTGRWWPTSWWTPVFGRGRGGPGHGAGAGCRAGRPALRAPLRRPFTPARGRRVAGGPGRLRDHRGGHRPRAPGPGLRRGRPPDRPRQRPARR